MARKKANARKQWRPNDDELTMLEYRTPARKRPLLQNKRDYFTVLGIIAFFAGLALWAMLPRIFS